jgi:hypothetical protein
MEINENIFKFYDEDENIAYGPKELTDADYIKIVKDNEERKRMAEKRREGARKARADLGL